jgi:hypothetical protein
MAYRLSDATLRKVSGGQRNVKASEVSFTGPTVRFKLNAQEREQEAQRKEERKRLGPSVRRIEKSLTAETPEELMVESLLNNTMRSLVLDGGGSSSPATFLDARAAVFASAIRNNRSVLAVTLRSLPITEIGACSIFESLKRNPTVRAVDVEYIGLTPKALRSLRAMVRENPGIIHLGLYQTGCEEEPLAQEAMQAVFMNRLVLPDPGVNPFENMLFAGMNYATDPEGFAWDAASDESEEEHFLQGEAEEFMQYAGKLARPVCGHYMHGGCRYGSRCRHFHPERRPCTETDIARAVGSAPLAPMATLAPAPQVEPGTTAVTLDERFTAPDLVGLLPELQRRPVVELLATTIAAASLAIASAVILRRRLGT